jgi:hypothetical protein
VLADTPRITFTRLVILTVAQLTKIGAVPHTTVIG